MAFFKFRRTGSGDEPAATPVQPETIEAMRRRAKHRLLGAAILVLIGVIGLPILFDKQPRPISVDIPIEIPDRNKVKPLTIPEPVATPATQAEASAPKASEVPPVPAAPVAKAEGKVAPSPITAASEPPKALVNAEPKAADKAHEASGTAAVKPDDGTQAQALLDGKDADKKPDASAGRFVVQVGAFADAARARDVRQKVEHAGLKTYTQVAETKDGQRIRVRVGPFATKAEADKASAKIKKLGLPAAILTL